MNTLLLLLATWFAGHASAMPGRDSPAAKLRVVATIPDLADIVGEIGGERIGRITELAKGTMNAHAVPVRPSSLIAVNKADLFVQIGLNMEHAYVPGLLLQARNPKIQPDGPGFVNCSEGWKAIEVPENFSRFQAADLHPTGNPHFNLDPRGGKHMADQILAGFLRIDPESREYYEGRHRDYLRRIDEASKRWEKYRPALKDAYVVTYHRDFSYFAAYYSMSFATVEPKPGVPPTPKDLARLVALMKEEGVKVVLTAHWSNNRNVRFVAEKGKAQLVEIPVMVGGVPGADSWIEMQDILHERIATALGGGAGSPPR